MPRVSRLPNLATAPPQLLASLAISVGVVAVFIAYLFVALGQPTGTRGNSRLLEFLSPADVAVAGVMIVAVALVVLLSTGGAEPTAGRGKALAPATVRMTAGIVSAFVAVAALIRAITALTISQQSAAVKIGNVIDALAAILVAGVAALWGLRTT